MNFGTLINQSRRKSKWNSLTDFRQKLEAFAGNEQERDFEGFGRDKLLRWGRGRKVNVGQAKRSECVFIMKQVGWLIREWKVSKRLVEA